MTFYNLLRHFSLVIVAGILSLLLLFYLYRFTLNRPPNLSQLSSTDQVVAGDCQLQQNSRKTRVQCNGNFKFKTTTADGIRINADVSGQNNRITVRSGNSKATKKNNITVSQSGNGSSVRITVADTRAKTQFDKQWSLEN